MMRINLLNRILKRAVWENGKCDNSALSRLQYKPNTNPKATQLKFENGSLQ